MNAACFVNDHRSAPDELAATYRTILLMLPCASDKAIVKGRSARHCKALSFFLHIHAYLTYHDPVPIPRTTLGAESYPAPLNRVDLC